MRPKGLHVQFTMYPFHCEILGVLLLRAYIQFTIILLYPSYNSGFSYMTINSERVSSAILQPVLNHHSLLKQIK